LKLISQTENLQQFNVKVADTFFSRFIGWLGKKDVGENEVLLLQSCNCIHTLGMRITIDVVFIDSKGCVLYMMDQMRPWRISPVIWQAKSVMEMRAGTIRRLEVKIGDKIIILS
jgi:uncharacterized membrane protein (UPF0127 family)